MSMVLQCKESGDFRPHPEGIHPAVCVDVIDLGMVSTEFQGQTRIVNKVKLVFETEQKTEDGKNCTVSRTFTASLHSKASLTAFLAKWRGRPVIPNEFIDLDRLKGACCTLVISHQQNMVGKTYASIDAVSKPTKALVPSGGYDGLAARKRIAEWNARDGAGGQRTDDRGRMTEHRATGQQVNGAPRPGNVAGSAPVATGGTPVPPTMGGAAAARAVEPVPAFDPDVGF